MKYVFIAMASLLAMGAICGILLGADGRMTQIMKKYEEPHQVQTEFENIFMHAQDSQFKILKTTPPLSDLKDGEVVIVSSNTVHLMIRSGQEIYSVDVSCVTRYR